MAINIWTFFFVVVFNNQYASSIEYDSLEQCLQQQYEVEKNPSVLYYEREWIDTVEYGCVKRIKRYVEECELLPMDYVNKKQCIPYWEHWAKNRR
jgi:hypothetical protein|tara:strand:+ start:1853 stop:2137 length:285 start_codon:yes stop_codon:yes gene_type:complete